MKIIDTDGQRAPGAIQGAREEVCAGARREAGPIARNVSELTGRLDTAVLDRGKQMGEEARIVVIGGIQAQPGGGLLASQALVALAQKARLAKSGGGLDEDQPEPAPIAYAGDQIGPRHQA